MRVNFIVKEFSRALGGWLFITCVSISLGLMLLGLSQRYPLQPAPQPGLHPNYYNAYDAWRRGMDAFALFAPLAASLAYADSWLKDSEQGLARYALLRTKHRHYLSVKLTVNIVTGGLAVALPMLLFFGYTWLVYARALPPLSTTPYQEAWMWAYGFLSEWFIPHPNWYILGRIAVGFFFGAAYATLGMSLSPFVRNRYVVVGFPLIFFWAFGFAANLVGLPVWWSGYALLPDGILTSTAITVLTPLFIILVASAAIILLYIKKDSDRYLY